MKKKKQTYRPPEATKEYYKEVLNAMDEDIADIPGVDELIKYLDHASK
ncbi:MAG: hypothetical protein IJN92_09935 [Lachnospiraceae bacterium]|nr:hypothetical protein [Lachnospiraceae bacterium]